MITRGEIEEEVSRFYYICVFVSREKCILSYLRRLYGMATQSHGSGMRCGLGSLVRISELNSAIAFLSHATCRPEPQTQLNYELHYHRWLFFAAAASYASSYSTKPSVHSAVQLAVCNIVGQNSSKERRVCTNPASLSVEQCTIH